MIETIEEFCNEVRTELEERFADDEVLVDVNQVVKNNGNIRNGITIRREDSNIAPTIYLDGYFNDFLKGKNISTCIDEIIETYECSTESAPVIDLGYYQDYEAVKAQILPKVINFERNRRFLEEHPYLRFGDLAVTFLVVVTEESGNSIGSVSVTNEHMETWGVTVDELYEQAEENARGKCPTKIRTIFEVVGEIMMTGVSDRDAETDIIDQLRKDGPQMYVMSAGKINGAIALTDTDALQRFADEHERNLFILPSSIHELIVLLDEGDAEIGMLENMVAEVNSTQVPPEDVLSGNVYYYDRIRKHLCMAMTKEEIYPQAC